MRTIILLILFATAAFADLMGTLTLDTSALVGNPAGPFTLDFQFIDGSPTPLAGDANNQITLSNFVGGILSPSPATVVMNDDQFFNEQQFAFTPGASFSFTFDATTNVDTVGPDTFTFAILDGSGNEIPTTNPNGFNSFFELDLPGPGTDVVMTESATDPAQTSILISAPTELVATPEPSSLVLSLTMLTATFLLLRVWRFRS